MKLLVCMAVRSGLLLTSLTLPLAALLLTPITLAFSNLCLVSKRPLKRTVCYARLVRCLSSSTGSDALCGSGIAFSTQTTPCYSRSYSFLLVLLDAFSSRFFNTNVLFLYTLYSSFFFWCLVQSGLFLFLKLACLCYSSTALAGGYSCVTLTLT